MTSPDLGALWAQFDTALKLEKGINEVTCSSPSSAPACICDAGGQDSSDDRLIDGFYTCSTCGVAKDIHIDTGAEWRSFAASENGGATNTSVIRCGEAANLLMPGTQLNTYIGKGGNARQQRVHQWYNVSTKERGIHQLFTEFELIATTNAINRNIAICATELYRKLQHELENRNCGVKRCNVRQGLKAACLYYACKKLQHPRERKDIADMFDTTTKIVTRGCNTFLDVMGDEYVHMPPLRPHDFLARFAQLLGMSYSDELYVAKIMRAIASVDSLADSTPTSIAAGCIYFYSVQKCLEITKSSIRDKCGSSPAIVTKIYNQLYSMREYIENQIECQADTEEKGDGMGRRGWDIM